MKHRAHRLFLLLNLSPVRGRLAAVQGMLDFYMFVRSEWFCRTHRIHKLKLVVAFQLRLFGQERSIVPQLQLWTVERSHEDRREARSGTPDMFAKNSRSSGYNAAERR